MREYETLTIGLSQEFDDQVEAFSDAWKSVKNEVNYNIDTELEELRKGDTS